MKAEARSVGGSTEEGVLPRYLLILAAFAALGAAAGAPAQPKAQVPEASPPLSRAQFIVQMDAEFRKMDADKNGQLTRAEIEQYQKQQAAAQAQARNRAVFTQLDTNKNGQLSKSEFEKMEAPATSTSAQPVLNRMDSNRDSLISIVEHRTATLANFDRLDVDRDGKVTAAELNAVVPSPR